MEGTTFLTKINVTNNVNYVADGITMSQYLVIVSYRILSQQEFFKMALKFDLTQKYSASISHHGK